jgi:hypothetical protein
VAKPGQPISACEGTRNKPWVQRDGARGEIAKCESCAYVMTGPVTWLAVLAKVEGPKFRIGCDTPSQRIPSEYLFAPHVIGGPLSASARRLRRADQPMAPRQASQVTRSRSRHWARSSTSRLVETAVSAKRSDSARLPPVVHFRRGWYIARHDVYILSASWQVDAVRTKDDGRVPALQ